MKKLISVVLVLAFVLTAGLTAFAETAINGISKQVLEWATTTNGVKNTLDKNNLALLNKTASSGTFEVTIPLASTDAGANIIGNSNSGVFIMGSGLENTTITSGGHANITNGQDGVTYYAIAFGGGNIYVVKNKKYFQDADVEGVVYSKYPWKSAFKTGEDYTTDYYSDGEIVLKVELATDKFIIYIDDVKVAEYTVDSSITGNQLALFTGGTNRNQMTFKNIKVNGVPFDCGDFDSDGFCDKGTACDHCGGILDGVAAVAGHSLTLDGKIGVNFFMDLSSGIAADDTAKMKFTLPDGTVSEIPVSSVTPDANGYYKFTAYVAAKEMTEDIKAQIVTSTKTGKEFAYSVRDYADIILADTENKTYDQKTQNLVLAMLNYGGRAQVYFDYNLDNLAFDDYKLDPPTSVDNATSHRATSGTLPEGVKLHASTLVLEDAVKVRHYFKVEATANIEGLGLTKSGEYYYLDSEGIAADKLSENTVTSIKSCGWSVTYGAYTYIYNMVNNSEALPQLKNVCTTLYAYAEAANAYTAP